MPRPIIQPEIVENDTNPEAELSADPIESHLGYAIFTTICCCTPLGIVAIYYASKVSAFLGVREYKKAAEASAKAFTWANWALALGLLCGGLSLLKNIVKLQKL